VVLSVCVALVLGVVVVNNGLSARADPNEPQKLDPKRFKKILAKIDPEIREAQKDLVAARKALETAKKALTAAINDEVFGEKGPTEGLVIDQLKTALKRTDAAIVDINAAIKAANKAQTLDKGGD